MTEWEFSMERFSGGWSWEVSPVGSYSSYSGWSFTKFGAKWAMRRLIKRIKKEADSKEVWTETI